MPPMRWIRLERAETGSWMTYRLPYPFNTGIETEDWAEKFLPGWEWVSGCESNPDTLMDDEELDEPDELILGPCVDDGE